jgi:ankyrin repeat protein
MYAHGGVCGGNALQRASSKGHRTIVQLLLDKGVDLNAEGMYRNALQAASSGGHEGIVQLLLEKWINTGRVWEND